MIDVMSMDHRKTLIVGYQAPNNAVMQFCSAGLLAENDVTP